MINPKAIAKLQNATQLSPEEFYRNVAATAEAKRGNFTLEGAIAVVLGAAGLQMGGMLGLFALASMPVAFIVWKLWDSHDRLSQIEIGDFRDCLPYLERQMYQQEISAITVEAQAVQDSAPENSQVNADTAEHLALMLNPIRSCLFLGASRSGKSLLCTTTANKIKSRLGDDLALWVISAKCDPEESGYWSAFDRISFYDFLYGDDTLKQEAISVWAVMLSEFRQLRQPSILVVDELQAIGAYCLFQPKGSIAYEFWQSLLLYVSALSSMGASTNKGLWGISPNGDMRSLGMTRAIAGAFTTAFNGLTTNWNETVWIAAKNNGLAPQNSPSKADKDNAAAMGTDLLTGLNGRWIPTMGYPIPAPDEAVSAQFNLGNAAIISSKSSPKASTSSQALPSKNADVFSLESLESAYKSSPDLGHLSSELQAIVEYAIKKNDWVTARDCQRNLTGFNTVSADQVRAWFEQLAAQGLGSVDGVGNSLKYRY